MANLQPDEAGARTAHITVGNTIIAGNTATSDSPDCFNENDPNAVWTSLGYNLIGDTSGCSFTPGPGDQLDVDPHLGPLQRYKTTAARRRRTRCWPEARPSTRRTPAATLTTDQCGEPRPQDGDGNGSAVSDIGAYEAPTVNRNHPPVCDGAAASPAVLWPPNHQWVSVAILGVTDPDHDPVTLTVTGVTQDEPVNGLGDGDTSPDAALQGGKLWLRAERAGAGNGRVYRVSFTADDGHSGSCTGRVTVCVPHDQGKGKACIDDGQQFNSFQP